MQDDWQKTASYRLAFAREWLKICRELKKHKNLDKIRIVCEVCVHE